MKALTIAVAALAVFFLALSMLISAPVAAPANGMDACMMCHPQAHPAGWEQSLHITDLKSGVVTASECTRCHDAQYCVQCHAQVQAMQRQQGATGQPVTAAPQTGAP